MRNPFAPVSRSLALEPRILFDAAAAVAIDQQQSDQPDATQTTANQPTTEPAPRQILAVDSRISGAQSLAASAKPNTIVVLVDAGQDGMAAISAALQQAGKVDSIQILGHGSEGQMRLGSSSLSATSADTARASEWASNLTGSADILIYGCRTGAGESGAALVERLAELTGADVAASTDDTGSSTAGGDWELERQTGQIESTLAISADALASYSGLMADASPTVTLSTASMDTLLGGQLTFTATFTNPSTQVGFAPFIDLILPATGKDGAGAEIDDGITFVSATFLGQTVTAYTITFDSAGNATHPLAKDASGQPVIVNAATYGAQAGDQLVVLQLPFASVISGQPDIPIVITAQLSNLADTTGSPNLTLKARGGFQFGNDSADNPTTDPTLFQLSMQSLIVSPTGLQLSQSVSTPEGETVTGPNFARTLTVTATPPPGQTLTDVDITQSLPNTVRITAITPGAGGTLTAITIGPTTITGSAAIAAALALDPFLSSYTVRYASLTAASSTVVTFFVPEKDAAGNAVLDPVTGDDRTITFSAPTATGQWLPLDVRDQTVVDPGPPPVVGPVTVTANGSDTSLVAKSVALQKSVAIFSNVGNAGLSPGDTLQYTLNLDISDYFALGKTLLGGGSLTIVDTIADGQTGVAGSAQISFTSNGNTFTLPVLLSIIPGPVGSGVVIATLDIAQALLDNSAIFGGALIGDLAFDGFIEGATRMVVTYRTTVNQAYTPTSYPQNEINEGDSVGNNATVSGTLLANYVLLTGQSEDDSSSAALTVPTNSVQATIVTVNGAAAPADVELKPGDTVTFKLAYDLTTGDYENFKLTAFMPLPLFDLGTAGSAFADWTYGSGDTNNDNVDSVSVGAGNSLVFDFGNYATASLSGSRVEVQFTLTVGNQPFADQRSLTVLGQSSQLTTIPTQQQLVSSGAVTIVSIAQPVLTISHGVIGTVVGDGVITDIGSPPPITDIAQLDSNLIDMDAGDIYSMATTIKNSGGLGAFDVTSSVTLPPGLSFSAGNLANSIEGVFRGDFGAPLIEGVDYSISGNTIIFLDAGGVPTLKEGRPGTPNDLSGENVLVIIYSVKVDATAAAGQNFQTEAALTNYASVNGGPDFTPQDRTDSATQAMAAPIIRKLFADGTLSEDDSSATHTTGADLVVGESMLYDIVITLPEGTTQNLRVTDLIPPGLTLDTSFGSGGYELITTTALSGALSGDFNGSVSVSSIVAPGTDGGDLALTFSAATTTAADNSSANNSFVIRVRLIASNVTGNQAGASRTNDAQLTYSDPDGDTPNGSTPIDRTVTLTDAKPAITVREPTIVLAQTYTIAGAGGDPNSVIKDDIVTYTFTLTNNNAGSDFSAFDINFTDTLPTLLKFSGPGLGLLSITYGGGASNNGGADFAIVGGVLQSATNANIDIPKGGSITIVVAGQVLDDIGSVAEFANTATVQWTSLDGTVGGERTGVDGLLNAGALNDYRVAQTAIVKSASGANLSRVGGMPDTPAPSPTDAAQTVAVGEIIRYRFATRIIAGDSLDSNFVVTLPDGLSFIDDATTKVGLLGTSNTTFKWSNGGSVSGNLSNDPYFIIGGVTNRDQTLIPSDPATSEVTAILNPDRINATDPRAIKFTIGNLRNDEVDGDVEMIYIEFNVRVNNISAVDTSDSLAVTAQYFSNATLLSTTKATIENIVEPDLANVQKTVTDFDPRTNLTTGIATVTVNFSNTGDGIAYETHLTDSMTGGINYALSKVVIDGTTYLPGSLPAGVTVSTTGGITADFSTVAVGASIQLIYTVEVPNFQVTPSSNATLTWSSLPESFQNFLGSSVGLDGAADGERLYSAQEGAGLGVISGILWDDTASATTSATPDGTGLAGQTVTLTWAGADNNFGTADDKQFSTTTADGTDYFFLGEYNFGVLPSGNYRIDAVNPIIDYVFPGDIDNVAARIDSDGGILASVAITGLGEASTATANVGYVRDNDAPINTLGLPPPIDEDTFLQFQPPWDITVADFDDNGRSIKVTLTVLHGTLVFADPNVADYLDSITGIGTAQVVMIGEKNAINYGVLGNLIYLPNLNYNGTDTLTVSTNDLGSFGDADGDGTPGEAIDDALTDTDTLTITINPVNDAPTGTPDAAFAVEAGGVNNAVEGLTAAGNVLKNDIDVDIATNGDALKVVTISNTLSGTKPVATGLLPTDILGDYGNLKINSAGNAVYEINNANTAVQALRLSGNTLTEIFTYQLQDIAGVTSTATITVTLRGANDNPVGVNDTGTATEAGGVANGTAGTPATGNVLSNDTDVDLNGETRAVAAIRVGLESAGGVFTGVAGGTNSSSGTSITTSYGTLTIGADGSYSYVVNQSAAAVQSLAAGDVLIDDFSYVVIDALGDDDIAQLQITITGANDNPVASDDVADAQAQAIAGGTVIGSAVVGGTELGAEVNPTGNVITIASRPATTDNGIDTDIDRTDNPNTLLNVIGARAGTEAAVVPANVGSGTTSANGTSIIGTYGTLKIGADGSYAYDVDSRNATVQGLNATQTLSETFTYEITDTGTPGLTDKAQLVITIRGINDPPVAKTVVALAREAGGIANGTVGVNPTGDAMANDLDPDGDTINVVGVRAGDEAPDGISGLVAVSGGTTSANGTQIVGTYGTLTIGANGTYQYILNNDNATAEALRLAVQALSERFTYQISDNAMTPESDLAEIIIVISGANDNPIGVDDTATAVEASGLNNVIVGSDPTGNLLTNDTDVDSVANGETKVVSAVRTGAEAASGTTGTIGSALVGLYGSLTLNADGSYQYIVDNANAAVQALRTSSNTLSELFTYTISDTDGATDLAQLTITIQGANDAPIANADTATADEAGGLNNATPGTNPSGNVLSNDTDVDLYGETKTITAISNSASVAGTLGSALTGTYGALTLNANGNYSYVVDNSNATVQGLRTSANTLTETFTYTMQDALGVTSSTTLTITIRGANDNPLAVSDAGTAVEAGGLNNTTPGSNGTGNVLTNDTDVDNVAFGETKTVTALVNNGNVAGTVGSALTGTYGALTLNADGSYTYVVDNANAAVEALRTTANTLNEVFTYTMRDTAGATSVATLTVTIQGANDTPLGINDRTFAWPPVTGSSLGGRNPQGNVLTNDTDVDSGDSKRVSGFRTGTEATTGSLDAPGTRLEGSYGWLTINSDGSFLYEVDITKTINLNRVEVVQDAFTYELTDTVGLTDLAQLTVNVFGRNDPPVAIDDKNFVTDANGPAITSGNVLLNDTDPDPIDTQTVTAIRTGTEAGTGVTGQVGLVLQGLYGKLVLNADGSYVYTVDLNNPDVNRAQGLGPILQDVFTYTLSDRGGLTDQAQLTITLDMMAPFIGVDSGWGGSPYHRDPHGDFIYRLGVAPATFVTQVVRDVNLLLEFSHSETDGGRLRLVLPPEISITSQAAGLGLNDDQAIRPLVLQASGEGINQDAGSRPDSATNRILDTDYGQLLRPTLRYLEILNRFEKSKVTGREGIVSLSADGQLPNISVFSAEVPEAADGKPAAGKNQGSAASFSQQLKQLSDRPGKTLPQTRPAN